MSQKITPFLWFNNQAEEAMNYYVETFNNAPHKSAESKIITIKRYPKDMQLGPVPNMGGKVLTGVFSLEGQEYMCLDGGPMYKFSEAVSLLVTCEDQKEIDYFWEKLSQDPKGGQCGWTKDKFGFSWQIVPKNMDQWLASGESEKSGRAMQAMMKMKKLDMQALQDAYDGK
jgi:predicted 3-demethylubiquinone-9 3-methyltransferase (glyoxalase superfamily)